MVSNGSVEVLIDPSASLWILMGPYKPLCVPINSNGSLWVPINPFASLWILMGIYGSS